jgi:hypothetical protein
LEVHKYDELLFSYIQLAYEKKNNDFLLIFSFYFREYLPLQRQRFLDNRRGLLGSLAAEG